MPTQSSIIIQPVDVGRIIDLRWRILRAGLPRETASFDGDLEPTTHHVAAEQLDEVVGCVTILRRPWNDEPAWQLRGMAVEPRLQGTGAGRQLVEAVAQIARDERYSNQFWCNARTPAAGFLMSASGWVRVGEEFVIPTAGPHVKMAWRLSSDARASDKRGMSSDALIVNPGRLKILTALASEPTQEFVQLRGVTRLTDGNLATHARRLHSAGFVEIDKSFREGKPVTTYTLTSRGRTALHEHVNHLVSAIQLSVNPAAREDAKPSQTVINNRQYDESDWID